MTEAELTRSCRPQSLFPLNQQNVIKLGEFFSLASRFLRYFTINYSFLALGIESRTIRVLYYKQS